MMKWGRRKPSSSSPSRASSISKVFPMSWLSKFKQKGNNSSEHKPTKANQKVKPNLASQSMPTPVIWRDNGRFYSGDDDSYWRLSFGEDRLEGEKSRGGLQSVRYDSDDDLEFPLSNCQKCRPVGANVGGREEMWKFNDMVSDIRKLRELPRNVEISPEIEFKVPRRKAAKDQKSRKTSRSVLEERRAGVERQSDKAEEVPTVPEEKEIFELEPKRITQTTEDYQKATDSDSKKQCYVSYVNAGNSYLKTIEEECAFEALNLQETDLEETDRVPEDKLSSEWLKMKDMKMKELMSKSEKQRKSVCMSRELQRRTMQRGKVRVYSPRTVARIECKIKAIEDMKKAKKMMKKKMKAVEEKTALDSFAVVKSSLDPQQDFRNSMIEMIMEKGLRRPEELEELLACYLTLNADEYHNLIIKVFRQVWFELNQEYFGLEIQNNQSCYG